MMMSCDNGRTSKSGAFERWGNILLHGNDQATCPFGYLFNFLHVTYQPARVLNLLTCCL